MFKDDVKIRDFLSLTYNGIKKIFGSEKDTQYVMGNFRVVCRERGKIVPGTLREGHNVWTLTGREYDALLKSYEGYGPDTAFRNDDRVLASLDGFVNKEVVVTIKMDGENTTMYKDYIHARSLEYSSREDRNWMRSLHASVAHDIPEGWRICGEQLYAEHSIHYYDLPSYFLIYSIWNDKNVCLSWDETKEWAELLGLEMVKEIYRGSWNELFIRTLYNEKVDRDLIEGHVVRITGAFPYKDYKKVFYSLALLCC